MYRRQWHTVWPCNGMLWHQQSVHFNLILTCRAHVTHIVISAICYTRQRGTVRGKCMKCKWCVYIISSQHGTACLLHADRHWLRTNILQPVYPSWLWQCQLSLCRNCVLITCTLKHDRMSMYSTSIRNYNSLKLSWIETLNYSLAKQLQVMINFTLFN